MSICGIYKITYKPNGFVYIGQSTDILQRWRDHLRAKDASLFHQRLQSSNITDFTFEIVEECDQDELDEKEQYWIQFYDSTKKGYNMTKGGSTGVLPSLSKNAKQVAQYSLEGQLLATFSSAKEAQDQTKVSQITSCCRGERITAGDYQWRYYESIPLSNIQAVSTPTSKPKGVVQYTLDGIKIREFDSIADASRAMNISSSSISSVCSGKTYSAGKFRWSYLGQSLQITEIPKTGSKKRVLQYNLQGEFIAEYESISAAARAVNGSASSIAAARKGQLKTSKKSIWKYKGELKQ